MSNPLTKLRQQTGEVKKKKKPFKDISKNRKVVASGVTKGVTKTLMTMQKETGTKNPRTIVAQIPITGAKASLANRRSAAKVGGKVKPQKRRPSGIIDVTPKKLKQRKVSNKVGPKRAKKAKR